MQGSLSKARSSNFCRMDEQIHSRGIASINYHIHYIHAIREIALSRQIPQLHKCFLKKREYRSDVASLLPRKGAGSSWQRVDHPLAPRKPGEEAPWDPGIIDPLNPCRSGVSVCFASLTLSQRRSATSACPNLISSSFPFKNLIFAVEMECAFYPFSIPPLLLNYKVYITFIHLQELFSMYLKRVKQSRKSSFLRQRRIPIL